ncbi:DUF2975 domain-containing protein [Sphingomonas sp. URHD0057]|uniref:DUF2975 domain-containing protein n=1 Tax=Sphingomonas sp. URHD0057 TaxID=1380389 RepID=UPI0018CC0EE6|nr:DUF2975 domain-containing protein [Sphingomonas sp. URHD0057]
MSDDPIRRSARRLRVFVFAAMSMIALVYVAARLNLQLAHAHVEYRLHGTPYEQWTAAGSVALLLIALFHLTRMLGLIAAGEMFGVNVVRHFRGFASWLLAMALFEFAAPIVAMFTAASASRSHLLRLNIDLRDALTVAITLLLFLLARLLERARRLDDEMREFV